MAREHTDPPRAQGVRRRGGRRIADVGDGGDLHARIQQVESGFIGAVIVGGDDRAPSSQNAEPHRIGPGGRGQHDAGPVIVGKDQRPLKGAGGEHDAPGANLP